MPKKKSQKRESVKPPPICKAIILADDASVDQATGKVSITGIITGFNFVEFPDFTHESKVYLQLVDGIGRYDVTVEIHDLLESNVIAIASGIEVEFSERLQRCSLIISVPRLKLAHPGKYDVVVLSENQEIDRQQFDAQIIEP